uniref:Uncharacterized protein n=1 Tax=Ficedula albicollis TaxID=59894 RepID=A0A803W9D5_FICAL
MGLRKSSRAKEKKQRRLEERAAMAAVCAKVEAANKVSVATRGGQESAAPVCPPECSQCSWCPQSHSWGS